MKKLHGLLIITSLIFFSSCNPKISKRISKTYPPIDYKQEIVVIGLDQSEPENAEVLGQVEIGDTGFTTNCSYIIVIDKAKIEARKAGGNAIKIIEHTSPTTGSACHRIGAKILKVENIENYLPKAEEEVLLVSTILLNSYKTNAFFLGISMGYIGYTNKFVLIDDFEMTGGTLGFVNEIGYDMGLTEDISLGIQLSYITGTLFKYKLSDGFNTLTVELNSEENELISLNHIDISVGLRIAL